MIWGNCRVIATYHLDFRIKSTACEWKPSLDQRSMNGQHNLCTTARSYSQWFLPAVNYSSWTNTVQNTTISLELNPHHLRRTAHTFHCARVGADPITGFIPTKLFNIPLLYNKTATCAITYGNRFRISEAISYCARYAYYYCNSHWQFLDNRITLIFFPCFSIIYSFIHS